MTVSMRLPFPSSERRSFRSQRSHLRSAVFSAALAGSLLAAAGSALAKPPEGVPIDPAVHEWFESLVRADGLHCCGAADCRVADPREIRVTKDGIEVLLNGKWQAVLDQLIVHRENAPFAATIVCKGHTDSGDLTLAEERLYCVVPYAGG